VHIADAVALLLLLAAVAAFGLGEAALARSEDLEALYWLVIGIVGVRAAVQLVKPSNA
jgi:hypothetical protein